MDINTICITEDKTVQEAMKQLDISSQQILYVTNGKKLLASLTDGDIRRHLLKGGQLTDKVKSVSNYHPKYILARDATNANNFMRNENVHSVPFVNEELEILDVAFLFNINNSKNQINAPVIIMAGGKGTRLQPYTKVLPKALIPIGEQPIVEHIMNKFIGYGCTDFHYIVNHKRQMIKAYFNEEKTGYNITFYDETTPLGTGGGLSLLKGKIDDTFFMTNCDSILNADYNEIYKFHKEQKSIVTMVCVNKHFTIPYGVISTDENGGILEIKEKPEYSFLTNIGFYLVEPEVLYGIEDNLAIDFPEIIDQLRKKEIKVNAYPVSEMSWLDIGKPDEMERALSLLERR